MTPLEIAAVCHEANRRYCLSLGDPSQPSWENVPGQHRTALLAGIAFHLATPGADDAASHACWMATRLAQGWTWGPAKDEVAKTHPCLVAFEKLPAAERVKDSLFRSIVTTLSPQLSEAAKSRLRDTFASPTSLGSQSLENSAHG